MSGGQEVMARLFGDPFRVKNCTRCILGVVGRRIAHDTSPSAYHGQCRDGGFRKQRQHARLHRRVAGVHQSSGCERVHWPSKLDQFAGRRIFHTTILERLRLPWVGKAPCSMSTVGSFAFSCSGAGENFSAHLPGSRRCGSVRCNVKFTEPLEHGAQLAVDVTLHSKWESLPKCSGGRRSGRRCSSPG